jgi:hypothetical protein
MSVSFAVACCHSIGCENIEHRTEVQLSLKQESLYKHCTVLRLRLRLRPLTATEAYSELFHVQALARLEQLKNSEAGWQFCMSTLTGGVTQHNHLKFFCFQVVEHYIKNRYNSENLADRQRVREFLSCWIQLQVSIIWCYCQLLKDRPRTSSYSQ